MTDTANGTAIGTARVDLVVNTSQFDAAITSAQNRTANMSKDAQASYAQLTGAQKRAADSLIDMTNKLGMTRQQQLLYNAALKGVPTTILDSLKAKFAGVAEGAESVAGAVEHVGEHSASATRELLTLVREGSNGNWTRFAGSASLLAQYLGVLPNLFTAVAGGVVAAAGAVAGLALAYEQGASEANAFNKALAQTGNYAGISAAAMQDQAKSIAQAVGATQHNVSDVMAQIVATGKFTGDAIGQVTEAAVDMQKSTDQAISATIAQFEKLADDPVKASKELNDQYHYLTAAVYEQISALVQQGDKTAAAQLAVETFANAIRDRTPEMEQNVGYLEHAWDSVTSAIKGAKDALLDIGRPETMGDAITKMRQAIAQVQAHDTTLTPLNSAGRARLENAQEALRIMEHAQTFSGGNSTTALDAQAAQQQQQQIQAYDNVQSYLKSHAGSGLTESLAEENKQFQAAIKNLDQNSAEYQQALEAHNDKIAEINKRFAPQADHGSNVIDQLRQTGASLQAQLDSSDKLTQAEKDQVKYAQLFADLKSKTTLTAEQKSLLANQSTIQAILDQNSALDRQLQQKEALAKLDQASQQINAQIATAQQNQLDQYGRQLSGIGLGSQEQQRLQQQSSIYSQYERYQDQLEKLASRSGTLGSDAYQKESATIAAQLQTALGYQKDYYAALDALNSNWLNGATSSLQDYVDATQNVASQTKSAFTDAFKGMEDTFVNFVTTGKLSFTDLANSIITDLARIAIRQEITGPLASGLQSVLSGLFGGGSASSAALSLENTGTTAAIDRAVSSGYFASGGYTGVGGKFEPAGIVHRGEYVLSQAATDSIGVGVLDRINFGYASGGMGGRPPGLVTAQEAAAAPVQTSAVQVTLINKGTPQQVVGQPKISMDKLGRMVVQIMVDDFQRNGPYAKQLKGAM